MCNIKLFRLGVVFFFNSNCRKYVAHMPVVFQKENANLHTNELSGVSLMLIPGLFLFLCYVKSNFLFDILKCIKNAKSLL